MWIYEIHNIKNDKVYIGQTIQKPSYRWSSGHKSRLNRNIHENPKLQAAWNKYGEKNFEFNLIKECENLKELNETEVYFIEKRNSIKHGYNIDEGGDNARLSESAKTKISAAQKRFWLNHSDEYKSARMKAISDVRSEEALQKMAETQKKRYTPEYRKYWGNLNAKEYQFTNPDGKLVQLKNLKRFCCENGLEYSDMIRVFKGERKQHKQWTAVV